MFADCVQVLCASGSYCYCKVHPGAGPVNESFHRCMNCALKFHSCITCSGVQFADWISGAAGRGGSSVLMLSQYGQEKFDCYKDDFSSLPLELCSYCQKSIALSINVGLSCGAVVVTATAALATTTAAVPPAVAGMSASPASNPGLAGDEMGTATGELLSSEEHHKKNHISLNILMGMCHGLKNDFDKDPWASMKVSTYRPSLLELKNEVRQRSKILIATKKGKKLSKKDNPSPSQWTIVKCQKWLEEVAITDLSDVTFLSSEMQAWLIIVTKAAKQKLSEEQQLLQYDDGNNWYRKDPILRLIHTLDETEIWVACMDHHNLSNECIVLDNAKSVEKREMIVWQKMVNVWKHIKQFYIVISYF